MHPIVDKASRALMYLQSSGGGDGSLPNYYILNDAPEWVKDLCCNAYEDSLPNNHIYHMIYNVLNVIVEEGSLKGNEDIATYDLRERIIEALEITIPPNYVIFKWLAECPVALEYVDAYHYELDEKPDSATECIIGGYIYHLIDVADGVFSFLEKQTKTDS